MTEPAPVPASGSGGRASRWWSSLGRGQRIAVAVLGLVVGANAFVSGVSSLLGAEPGGPTSSAFGTRGDGLEAWADLLAADGRTVTRRGESLADGSLDPGATAVVADPKELSEEQAGHLARFVAGGGRLVLAGGDAAGLLAALTGVPVGWSGGPTAELEVWVPSVVTGSAQDLAGDAGGRWSDVGPLAPLAGDRRGPVLVAGAVGAGEVVALADAEPLHNRNLARADNAALALAIVGDAERPVVFVESVRGQAVGLAAVPSGWKWATAGLLVALVAGLWSAAARFGPPEPARRALRPPRRDHVEAVAATLEAADRRRASPSPPGGGDGTVTADAHRPGGTP